MKEIDYGSRTSLEIIRGENLPKDLLKNAAIRLKGYTTRV